MVGQTFKSKTVQTQEVRIEKNCRILYESPVIFGGALTIAVDIKHGESLLQIGIFLFREVSTALGHGVEGYAENCKGKTTSRSLCSEILDTPWEWEPIFHSEYQQVRELYTREFDLQVRYGHSNQYQVQSVYGSFYD